MPSLICLCLGKKKQNGGKASIAEVLTEVKMEDDVYTIYFYSTAANHLLTFTRTSRHALGHVFGRKHSDLYGIMSPVIRNDDIYSESECSFYAGHR